MNPGVDPAKVGEALKGKAEYEAIENTLAERGARYGDFTDHAQLTDDLLSSMEASPNWADLPAWQRQGLRVIADKIARMLTGDPGYVDNAHDIIGYAKLIEDRLIEQERAKNGPELPLEIHI